ncbi:hypothetical protein [Sphingomonas sp. RS2018]
MPATIALYTGIAFAIVAVVRSFRAVPMLRHLQLAMALTAGLFGIATWHPTGDSRWLVGGVLFFGAGLPGWLAGNRRSLTIAALVVGLLALALFGMAMANPMALRAA